MIFKTKIIKLLKISFVLIYLILFIYILVEARFRLRFSYLLLLILPFSLLEKKSTKFIKDWSFLFFIVFIYDTMRSFADNINSRVNYTFLPNLEKLIFHGNLPTILLQQHFSDYATNIVGKILTIFYLSHFFLPVFIGYYLWKKNSTQFSFFVKSFMLLNILAVFSFLMFPAAPPWLASQNNIIPPVTRYLHINLNNLFYSNIPLELFNSLDANPTAPFPSLHAAYPLLLTLICRKFLPKLTYILLFITLIISFTLIFFGEHYFIDILVGYAYSLFTFYIVFKFFPSLPPSPKK